MSENKKSLLGDKSEIKFDSKPESKPEASSPDSARERRRIILPKKTNQIETSDVTIVPTITSLLNDAACIIGEDLARYRSKTKRGVSLDLKEARIIANYTDVLIRAAKEAREQARAEDLADLSNEELLQLASQIANSNKRVSTESEDE